MDNRRKKMYHQSITRESMDDDLVRLEAEFRNAYTLKALEAQLAEKEADRIAGEVQEKLSWRLIALERERELEKEQMTLLEASRTRTAYRKVLEEQISLKVEAKHLENSAAREERKILAEVDELMDKVHELAKRRRRNYDAERSRRERLLFEEIREIKRALEVEEERMMVQRELQYCEEVERRSMEVRKLRLDQQRRREELIEEVARLFVDESLKRREREAVISDLVAEEIRHEAMMEERQLEEARKIKKVELASDLMNQMRLTVEAEARARERNRNFIEQVMARVVMEDRRLTSLTMEARKRRQLQYKADLEKLIVERERMREDAVTRARAEANERLEREEARQERIREERLRLIEQHAGNVAAYLKDGILAPEEENIVKDLLNKCKQSLMN